MQDTLDLDYTKTKLNFQELFVSEMCIRKELNSVRFHKMTSLISAEILFSIYRNRTRITLCEKWFIFFFPTKTSYVAVDINMNQV